MEGLLELTIEDLRLTIEEPSAASPTAIGERDDRKRGRLRKRTKAFAIRIIRLCRSLPNTSEARIIGNQLLRCGSSVGANTVQYVGRGLVLISFRRSASWSKKRMKPSSGWNC